MRLILLRHAKSDKAEPGQSDRDRPLNARGRKDATRIGAYIAYHGIIPDIAKVSPARRTQETWDQVATEFSVPPKAEFENRLYNAAAEAILDVTRETRRPVRTLLIVGHNPGLHELARLLIAAGDVEARERLNEGLPTAGLAVIDFAGDDWRKLHPNGGRLDRFVTPRSLKAATD